MILDFECPILDLQNKITDLKKLTSEGDLDLSKEIVR
jgi:acetyl-CoA carboxylase alpha subunit